MDSNNLPIIVAGGGIGGISTGLMLARRGYKTIIIEQNDEFGEVGAGIQIGPNAFRMFDEMGITRAINDVAVFPEALVMNDALSGELVTRLPLNDHGFKQHFEYPYAVIYRPDLHRILLDAAMEEGNLELKTGCEVLGFEDRGSHVEVQTSSGEINGAALIGADGLWSKVRSQMNGEQALRITGHVAYRAVLNEAEVPEINHKNEVILWAGPRTHLVHYPLHRGEIFNLVAVFHSQRYEEGWDIYGDVSELNDRFAGQHKNVLGMLEKVEAWRMWVLCDREPEKDWSKGAVTLLGDAAHPTLQYLAQGACMAMEDAVCIANMVKTHGSDYASAFKAYQNARYLRAGRVQLTSRFYGDVYHARGVEAELRKNMLSARDSDAAYQGMNWLYNGVDKQGRQIL
ncbi:MAG: 3-hydroxybenzoate 6-monooxygenase [Rhizobiaceae bacterium]|nr:3-hydroxybenzoate 6-monooxygenase [Rhizobiaceae bacterium]